MLKDKIKLKEIIVAIIIIIMCGVMFFYQTKKIGFHEDEIYTIVSSVNPYDGVISPYGEKDNHTIMIERHVANKNIFIEIKNAINYVLNQKNYDEEMGELYNSQKPVWKTKEDIKKAVTLSPDNYLNLKSIYYNQTKDSHPPFFYVLVHFTSILFNGQFTKYCIFTINIIAFIFSCLIIKKTLKIINKENLTIPTLILFGLSMGTITMVIYQRMYMVLTFFILLYFYLSIKLYKNDFNLTPKLNLSLGITTVLGFLTQYFFVIYAFFIFILMIIKMIKDKKYKNIIKYVGFHILYAIIGILIFIPCINHLLFTDRGVSNLANSEYFKHLCEYIGHLLYAFTIKNNMLLFTAIFVAFLLGFCYLYKKSNIKFITLLTIIPSICYFLVVVKLTSFQELRYIMPMSAFISITLFLIIDNLLKFKYKNTVMIIIAIILVLNGLVFSKPKLLFEEYKECLDIAQENKDKSFVFVFDNFFNHIQSVPEMMTYEKTMIINVNRDELKYVIEDEKLNSEDSYILCIKTYMNNEEIIQKIKENTDFKNVTQVYHGGNSHEIISNNLYIVSK